MIAFLIRTLAGLITGTALVLVAFAVLLWAEPVKAGESCGQASWYGAAHHGRRTASGEVFNMNAMTAASNSLPLGSKARVTAGKRSVVVRITDTGGFGKYGRIIDLSKAAFAKLAPTGQGIVKVCVERAS